MTPYIYPGLPKEIIKKYKKGHSNTVVEKTCIALDVSIEDIRSKSKERSLTDARAIIAYILHSHAVRDREIAVILNRDRSTVIVSIQKAKDLLNIDKIFSEKIKSVLDLGVTIGNFPGFKKGVNIESPVNRKRVNHNGRIYESINDCAKTLKYGHGTVRRYCTKKIKGFSFVD